MPSKSLLLFLLCVFCLTSITSVAAPSVPAADKLPVEAVATKVEELDDRSEWLWRNQFNDNRGIISTILLANDEGKGCRFADDFKVPANEVWKVDTIRPYLYWYQGKPDRYRVIIYKDDGWGMPDELSKVTDFTFNADLADTLTVYSIDVNVTAQNIELQPGEYWLSVAGEYDTATMSHQWFCLWNRKDTLLEPGAAHIKDSIGAHYTQFPTEWLPIHFANENTMNSAKFWIRGSKTVAITNQMNKFGAELSLFPNPAAEFITFTASSRRAKYVEIFDMKGKLVEKVGLKDKKSKVSLAKYINGLYLYRLKGETGNVLNKGRFTVSK